MSILLADDDVHLANFLSKSLESEGYSVHTALNEESVVAELKRQNYKLIILDLNFGETDGLQLLERLRAEGLATPVLVLSARNKVSDRIQSLNLGADDYVTKPFSFQELAARANALLRRKADPSLSVLRVEDLELDPALRRVSRNDRDIKLSPKEFDLLHLLMRRSGHTVSRHELLAQAWGLQPETDSNLVDVYVNYLRKKIDFLNEEKLIHTVRGSGYRVGRPAPLAGGSPDSALGQAEALHSMGANQAMTSSNEPTALQQTPWRVLVNSVAHDLAQPLTSVRCFLEVVAMRGGTNMAPSADLKNAEQQTDRAIALAKTIASLVREMPVPVGPWTSLDSVLNDVFNEFIVLLNSALLTVERNWDPSIQVTSSPVVRHLLTLLIGKMVGRNSKPVILFVASILRGGRCHLDLRWRTNDGSPLQEMKTTFSKEMMHIQEMVYSIGGELTLEGENGMALKLPAAPQAAMSARETLQ
jgi:DNA-binding response OmpR family regulator